MRLLVLVLLLLPNVTFANQNKVNYLNSLMPNMIDFIEDNSLYAYNGEDLPNIIIVNEKDVCTGAFIKPVDTCDIAGYYNHDTNEIYLRNEPTQYMVKDRFHEVILVHELVHFLQYMDGTYEVVECRQNLETHAYDIQEKFIDLHGIDPKQKPEPLFAMITSMCPNQHPLMFHSEQ